MHPECVERRVNLPALQALVSLPAVGQVLVPAEAAVVGVRLPAGLAGEPGGGGGAGVLVVRVLRQEPLLGEGGLAVVALVPENTEVDFKQIEIGILG